MTRTPKAQALGAALRQARETRNLLLRELAAAIGRDIGVVSRWETGDRTPKPEQVAQILTKLEVTGELYDEIMTLAYGTNESQWVATTLPEQRQQLAAYVDWEQRADRIVEVAPLLVPGILQTREYVRGIMTAAGVPASEIAMRITSRLGRADAITKRKPARLSVFLGVAALCQEIGGRATMVGQLDHLLTMAAMPHIELRVVPDRQGWHPALEGAFALIEAPRPAAGRRAALKATSIVFVETRRSVLMLHQDTDVTAYRQALSRIEAVALPVEPSAHLLRDIRKRMESQ
jgi:transcriptional regulator with XRE-family HTH domain